MGSSPGGVRFPDGKVLFFHFSSTSDIASPGLYDTPTQAWKAEKRGELPAGSDSGGWRRLEACCAAKHPTVRVLAVIDDDRQPWEGQACSQCRVFHGPLAMHRSGYEPPGEKVASECKVNESTAWYRAAVEALPESPNK